MTDKKVTIDDFEKAVFDILADYSQEVTRETKAECKKGAEFCAEQIRILAPKKSGTNYANSWRAKKAFEDAFDVRYTVYSKKYYPLTHLLEHGHRKVLWGHETFDSVKGIPHIKPAREETERILVNGIKVRLSK